MMFVSQDGFAYRRTAARIPSGLLNTQYLDSYSNLFVMIHALSEFGIQPDEIKRIRFFIMGDDNSAFTHWPLTRVQQFISFLSKFARSKYGMIINTNKSITTDQRQYIQTLSYECNFGFPRRPMDKLIAQLCYPEHGHAAKYMSMRAIGIAYASCGQDLTFYQFCKDIYQMFLPFAEPLTPEIIQKMTKYLPGTNKMMDSVSHFLQVLQFPELSTIHNEVRTWKGELPFSPKWNPSHFTQLPTYIPHEPKTLEQYNADNSIHIPTPPTLTLG